MPRIQSESCPPNPQGAISEFKAVRALHHSPDGRNEALHIIQSWNEAESQTLRPTEVNAMGRLLVGEYFKDHQFVIVTHTETGKFHNHIVVNTLNSVTGKQVAHKFSHLHELRKRNDSICLERGLSVPTQAQRSVPRFHQRVYDVAKRRTTPWVADLARKAEVARMLSTDFQQYREALMRFGIETRVGPKTLTYFYPGKGKGKRGEKLGPLFTKSGLEEFFESRLIQGPESRRNRLSPSLGLPKPELAAPRYASQHELSLFKAWLPEIERAKRPIPEYCRENGIPVVTSANGTTHLRDNPFIQISGSQAVNTRNGISGTLIDLVAALNRTSLIEAVGAINGVAVPPDLANQCAYKNSGLGAFRPAIEQGSGKQEFTPLLERFLNFYRIPRANAAEPMRLGLIQTKGNSILFCSFPLGTGALHYSERHGVWSERATGVMNEPFYSSKQEGKGLRLFLNPIQFLQADHQSSGPEADEISTSTQSLPSW